MDEPCVCKIANGGLCEHCLPTLSPWWRAFPQPTQALPGTPEKVDVLTARVEAKAVLFHPDDARAQED